MAIRHKKITHVELKDS